MSSSQSAIDLMRAEHEEARRSPDHVVDGVMEMFAAVETTNGGGSYIRLYLRALSDTAGGWIAVNLHDDDAAGIIADLGGALHEQIHARMLADGCVHEIDCRSTTTSELIVDQGEPA